MKICVKLICLQTFIATFLMRRIIREESYNKIKDEISPSHILRTLYAHVYVKSVQIQIIFYYGKST